MGTESKGRAWIGKIFNKLETILVEVDTFTYQSTLCLRSASEWESVRVKPEDHEEDPYDLQRHYDRLALPSSESPSDPPLHQNFDTQGHVRFEEDGVETLSGAPSAATLGNGEEQIVTDEESHTTTTLVIHGESRGEVSVESWTDFVSTVGTCIDDAGVATIEISTDNINLNRAATKIKESPARDNVANMTNHLYFDDSALYAVHVRTKKLRSFKRRVLDALASKRIREKEYEQLAIWFGDAEMGSDLKAKDSKSSKVLEPEGYQWELL